MYEFHRAQTLGDALELIGQMENGYTLYAGGTDLTPAIKAKVIKPREMVYIGGLPELRCLKEDEDVIRIGALLTHAELSSSELIKSQLPVLAEACRQIGSPQVRNLATIGGNLIWASPAADSAPALLALDARLNLVSLKGERTIPIHNFFRGPNKTEIQAGEILKEIIVPKLPPHVAGMFTKVGKRKALAISVLNCAVVVNGDIFTAKIALGSVGPFPFRALKAEKAFKETRSAVKAGEIAAEEATPITDARASAWYRKRIAGVIVERALNACLAVIKGEQA